MAHLAGLIGNLLRACSRHPLKSLRASCSSSTAPYSLGMRSAGPKRCRIPVAMRVRIRLGTSMATPEPLRCRSVSYWGLFTRQCCILGQYEVLTATQDLRERRICQLPPAMMPPAATKWSLEVSAQVVFLRQPPEIGSRASGPNFVRLGVINNG